MMFFLPNFCIPKGFFSEATIFVQANLPCLRSGEKRKVSPTTVLTSREMETVGHWFNQVGYSALDDVFVFNFRMPETSLRISPEPAGTISTR